MAHGLEESPDFQRRLAVGLVLGYAKALDDAVMKGDAPPEACVQDIHAQLFERLAGFVLERALRLDLREHNVRDDLMNPAKPDGVAHCPQVHYGRAAGDEHEIRGLDGPCRVAFGGGPPVEERENHTLGG